MQRAKSYYGNDDTKEHNKEQTNTKCVGDITK